MILWLPNSGAGRLADIVVILLFLWHRALPVLVGNNRVYSRCGCKLVR